MLRSSVAQANAIARPHWVQSEWAWLQASPSCRAFCVELVYLVWAFLYFFIEKLSVLFSVNNSSNLPDYGQMGCKRKIGLQKNVLFLPT